MWWHHGNVLTCYLILCQSKVMCECACMNVQVGIFICECAFVNVHECACVNLHMWKEMKQTKQNELTHIFGFLYSAYLPLAIHTSIHRTQTLNSSPSLEAYSFCSSSAPVYQVCLCQVPQFFNPSFCQSVCVMSIGLTAANVIPCALRWHSSIHLLDLNIPLSAW